MRMNPPPEAPLERMPLYRQLEKRIRCILQNRLPGERIPTQTEFAERFKVSVFTVRQALMALERDGLIERRQGSGVYACDKKPQSKHVGVLLDVDETSPNLSPYFPLFVREIRRALTDLGIASRPYHGNSSLGVEATSLTCQDLLDDVHLGRISGVISFFTRRAPEWTDLLSRKSIPVIDPEYYRVDHKNPVRDEEFLHDALRYFSTLGCRRVGLLIWESPTDGLNPMSRPFLRLAQQYGLEADMRWMDITVNGWERGMGWERFRDIWRSKTLHPDGLIIADDMLFADCQKAILELNVSVPEDLAVVVSSSDAVVLEPQFPIYNRKNLVRQQAKIYATEMQALLRGEMPPSFDSWPHVVELLDPSKKFTDEEESVMSEIFDTSELAFSSAK